MIVKMSKVTMVIIFSSLLNHQTPSDDDTVALVRSEGRGLEDVAVAPEW